jgi:hypothetical protein
VRRVLDAEVKNGTLRLAVQRLGQARPSKLEICRERDRRSPSARRVARAAYETKAKENAESALSRIKVTKLTTGVDLEKSFGPVYTRGLLRRGRSAVALLGVNAHETQSSIDAALTFGILWLDVCSRCKARMCWWKASRCLFPVEAPLWFGSEWRISIRMPPSGLYLN